MMSRVQAGGLSRTALVSEKQDGPTADQVSAAGDHQASQYRNVSAEAADPPVGGIVLHEDQPFHIVPHIPAQEVPYGTLCLRLKPRATGGYRPLVTKGGADHGDPQRLSLAMRDDRIVLSLSLPYAPALCEWILDAPTLQIGSWVHLALTFDHCGTALYVDGTRASDDAWTHVRGPHATPTAVTDFSLENNARPIVLGYPRQLPPEASASDETPDLEERYFGPLEFALWGGFSTECTLTPEQILWLATQSSDPQAVDEAPSARPDPVSDPAEPERLRADALPDISEADDMPTAPADREPELA